MIVELTNIHGEVVEPRNRDLARTIMELLHDYHKDGGQGGEVVSRTYADGVQVFWVEPRIKEERQAVSFYIDREGIHIASGWLKLDRE